MPLVVLGTNHRTAKLDLRERWSYQAIEITTTLKHLSDKLNTNEIILLSTCNRTEVYCDINNPDDVIKWFNEEIKPVTALDIKKHGYFYQNKDAVSHIMRVASGLDSLVLGEPEILGQFKQAYRLAQKANTVGKKFGKLFNQAFSAAKSVRTNTDIGSNSMSVASASVNLVVNEFCDSVIDELEVLLIGSGDTIKTVGRSLIRKNITKLSIVNRNHIHAKDLAEDLKSYAKSKINKELNIDTYDLSILNSLENYKNFNIIFSATRSPVYILTADKIQKLTAKFRNNLSNDKLLLIDLAVPRDIEPICGSMAQVKLYTVDDLENILNNNLLQRKRAAIQAEEIIKKMANEFCSWENSILLMSSLCKYREQAELMCRDVIEKAEKKLDAGEDPKYVVISSLELLRNKLLHHPTITLKNMVQHKSQSEIEELKDLFNL
jgi:glutamyl-tRNA reductase